MLRNNIRGLLQRHAPQSIKRRMWNTEYSNGRWDSLYSMPDDCVLPHLSKYANGGDILDLGCGPGAIGEALDPACYRTYLGIDISDIAIAKAQQRSSRRQNAYQQGDMASFVPRQKYDVILFGDSVYYFTARSAGEILHRYSTWLNGVLLMRSWIGNDRARAIVSIIDTEFDVVEKHQYAFEMPMLVVAFKPRLIHNPR